MLKIISRDILSIIIPYLKWNDLAPLTEIHETLRANLSESLMDYMKLDEVRLPSDEFRGLLTIYIKCKIFDSSINYKFLAFQKEITVSRGNYSNTVITVVSSRVFTRYRLLKDGKTCKQKPLLQSIKSAIMQINMYRATKFTVDEELEKLAVMIYPVVIANVTKTESFY